MQKKHGVAHLSTTTSAAAHYQCESRYGRRYVVVFIIVGSVRMQVLQEFVTILVRREAKLARPGGLRPELQCIPVFAHGDDLR